MISRYFIETRLLVFVDCQLDGKEGQNERLIMLDTGKRDLICNVSITSELPPRAGSMRSRWVGVR